LDFLKGSSVKTVIQSFVFEIGYNFTYPTYVPYTTYNFIVVKIESRWCRVGAGYVGL
jgi:hypothetical protein